MISVRLKNIYTLIPFSHKVNPVRKVKLSVLLSAASFIYLLNTGTNHIYSPWDYGFHQPSFSYPGPGTSVPASFSQIKHSQSILYVEFSEIIRLTTGMGIEFLYLPGIVLITLLLAALLRDHQSKLLLLFASIGGPLGAVSYFYNFRRDSFGIIYILTFLILYRYTYKKADLKWSGPILFFASLTIWLTHYTTWPFFAAMAIMLTIFNFNISIYSIINIILIISPFTVYSLPAETATGIIPVLLSFSTSDIPSLFSGLYVGQAKQIPQGWMVVNAPGSPSPSWLVPVTYLAYAIIIGSAVLICVKPGANWLYSLIRSTEDTNSFELKMWISIVLATISTSIIYIIIGYLYRIAILWPLALPAGIYIMSQIISSHSTSIGQLVPSRKIVLSVIILISLIHLVPLTVPGYYDPATRPGQPVTQQVESASWSSYAQDKPIYTDLSHANIGIIETNNRWYNTGYAASLPNGSVAIDNKNMVLFGMRNSEGYILVSHQTAGTRTGGSTIPPVPQKAHMTENRIYDNRVDAWYLGDN